MDFSIDTKPLRDFYIPQLQRDLDTYAGGRKRRFHICRVHVHADLLLNRAATSIKQLFHEERLKWARQEALQWQADPGDDLDEEEVFKHLKQQAETSPLLERAVSQSKCKKHVTPLGTSLAVQLPLIVTENPNRPFFHRYCIRWSIISIWGNDLSMCDSAIPPDLFPNVPKHNRSWWPYLELKIDGANYAVGKKLAVLWQLQFDFVDLQTYCSSKRRRINQFQRVPSAPVEKERQVKEYRGVRVRKDRKKSKFIVVWKPSSSKHKVDFCAFKTHREAALGADAVFHYYGKPNLLNFPEMTPQILSGFPLPSGLNEKDTKKFVQEKVKWLASKAPELRPSTTAKSSSRAPSGFPTISEPLSIPSSESDDGRFQPQASFQEAVTSAAAAVNTVQEPGQCSHDDPLFCAARNSAHICDEWDSGLRRPTFSATLSDMVSTLPSDFESISPFEEWPGAPLSQTPQSPMYDVDVHSWFQEQSQLWSFSGTPVDGCLL